jgi:putative heme-binding domain-containing protein
MTFLPFRTPRCYLAFLSGWLLCSPAIAQRNLKDIPDPDPELERQTFQLAEGLEVNLFAADPLLAKPLQMNFDPQGRLWVASSTVYPQIKPGEVANDKVLVLEDTNGDGKADTTQIFAEGLLIPTGVEPGDGGAYVANSTELVHFADTNGDGKADKKRIVLSGFGTEDTHHILHTLRWGPEGLLYMNQSIYIHSHIETPYGVRRMNGGGIWHFRPETMQLETFMLGLVNPWGHSFDRFGQSFATDGAGGEGINYIFPGWVGVTSPGAQRVMHGLNPGSPKYCGLERISGRHFPADWQGNLITNDFRAHRVCRFVISEDGSGFASKQAKDVISSSHVAFRPIDVKLGPDGALYIADWYNPIIQHGEVDFRDPRRDHVHGRIWRVTVKDSPLVSPPQLVGAPVAEVLEQLKSPEQETRVQAKRVLKELGAKQVLPALATWVAALDPADAEFEQQRLEGLWTYQTLDSVNPQLLAAVLASPDARVRAAAVRVVYHWHDRLSSPLALISAAANDVHPRVRLEAVRAASRVRSPQACEVALQALDRQMDANLDFALWTTVRDLAALWRPALEAGQLTFGGNTEHLTFALKAVGSADVVPLLLKQLAAGTENAEQQAGLLVTLTALANPQQLAAIYALCLDEDRPAAQRAAILSELAAATARRKVQLTGDLSALGKLLESEDAALRAAALQAAGAWKQEKLHDRISAVATMVGLPAEVRGSAMQALAKLGGESSLLTLEVLAGDSPDTATRSAAIAALATLDVELAAAQAAKALVTIPQGEDPASLLTPLLARAGGPELLAKAIAGKSIETDIAKLAVRAVRATGGDYPGLVKALATAGKLKTGPQQLSPEMLASLLAEIRSLGDPARGEAIFRRADLNCQKCHAIGGAGGAVGPDLVSIGGSAQLDYLVESLLQPSKKIKENYHSLIVLTDDGRVLSGVKLRETDSDLILRTADDREIGIPLDEIEQQKDGGSLMPAGLIDELTRTELVDLVRFLSELGKQGDYAIGSARLVRRWQVLLDTPENRAALLSGTELAAATNSRLPWGPKYSRVSGELPWSDVPVLNLGEQPVQVARFELVVTTPGEFQLGFNELKELSGDALWLDGKPLSSAGLQRVSLDRGRHQVTILHAGDASGSLRVELSDVAAQPGQAQIVGGK